MIRDCLCLCLLLMVAASCSKPGKPAAVAESSSAIVVPSDLEERFLAPPGIEWGSFRNSDGARIRYSHLPAQSPRATAVLVTGHTEFAEKYFELMRELNTRGIEVWQMDWRGYGASERYLPNLEMAHSLGVVHDTSDLHQFATKVIKPTSARRFLIAHSMGGNLSLRYLHDYPDTFAFAVVSSPFLSMGTSSAQNLPDWVVRSVIWGACFVGRCEDWARGAGPWADVDYAHELSHDPSRSQVQRAWFRSNPELRIGGVTNGWVREYMRSHDVLAERNYLAEIRTPTLLGSATLDPITRSEVHGAACGQMGNCKLVTVKDALHELFMESDAYRKPWMDASYAFAAQHGVN